MCSSDLKQEADFLDPQRLNVGWKWEKDAATGKYVMTSDGKRKKLQTKAQMPQGLYSNAAGIMCHTFVLEDFTLSTMGLRTVADGPLAQDGGADGGDAGDGSGDGDGGTTQVSKEAHLNHFVSTVLRYDDTKYANPERDRVGFYRVAEYPTLKLDMEQAYYNGNEIGRASCRERV